MSTPSSVFAGLPFRSPSREDSDEAAQSLVHLTSAEPNACKEMLARMYGFSGFHEDKAVFPKDAAAGPFDDELSPSDIAHRNARAAALLEQDSRFALKAPLANLGWELVFPHLGAFHRPRERRRLFSCLKRAIKSVAEENWSLADALHFEQVFAPAARFESPDADLMARWRDLGKWPDTAKPKQQLALMRQACKADISLGKHNLSAMFQRWRAQRWPNAMEYIVYRLGNRTSLTAQEAHAEFGRFFWNRINPPFSGMRDPFGENVSDAVKQEVADFSKNPDPAVAARNPVLSRVPFIVELAHNWPLLWNKQIAESLVSLERGCVVLQTLCDIPNSNSTRPAQTGFCSIWLEPLPDVGPVKDMTWWRYTASFFRLDGDNAFRPVALFEGTLVDPYLFEQQVTPESFSVQLAASGMQDDESYGLNGLWKVLQYELVNNRFGSLGGYLRDFPHTSFASVTVKVHPDYNSKAALPELVKVFLQTFNLQTASRAGSKLLDSTFVGVDASWMRERISPPSGLVFPVEGTPPARNWSVADLPLMFSSDKATNRELDEDIEKGRARQATRYRAMRQDLRRLGVAAEIVVYDPWSYPRN